MLFNYGVKERFLILMPNEAILYTGIYLRFFFTFINVFLRTWIRMRTGIPNTDPDPEGHWKLIQIQGYGTGSCLSVDGLNTYPPVVSAPR